VLLRAVDFGLAAVILIAPLVMGGRHPVGRLVFVGIVCATTTAWALRQTLQRDARWRWSGAELLAIAGTLLLLIQLFPLPSAFIESASPITAELLPLWTTAADCPYPLGNWPCLSLTPVETRMNLVMFLAYAMLFLVVVQRVKEIEDIERLMGWLGLAAVGMAAIGLAQFLAGNGKFLWFYEHPSRDTFGAVKGTFANENHFAHYLALGLPAVIWRLQRALASGFRSRRSPRRREGHTWMSRLDIRLALAIGLGVVSFAALLTFSRGGVIVVFVSSAICVGLYTWRGLLERKALASLAGVGVVVAASLLVFGYGPLARQLETLATGSLESLDNQASRRTLWAADLDAFSHAPLLGTGAGSHEAIYPTFYPKYAPVRYTHAESGYIQILLETGVVGLALTLVGLGICGYWCVCALKAPRDPRRDACMCAVIAALAVSLLNSVWDFVWYVPACLSLTLMLAACSYRLFALSTAEQKSPSWSCRTTRLSRFAWLAGAAGVAAISVVMVKSQVAPAAASRPWERYQAETKAAEQHQDESAMAEYIPVMIRNLELVVENDPQHAQANSRLAALYLAQFDLEQRTAENPVTLAHIRGAAIASRFASRKALFEWLAVAVGDNVSYLEKSHQHLRRAVKLCPLLGPAYVHLSDLAFLHGASHEANIALTEQAMRVRPRSGPVLFAAGSNAAAAGDLDKALGLWKQAFHQDPTYRKRIIELLAPHMTASQLIAEFEPNLEGLAHLYSLYLKVGRDDQARVVAPVYVKLVEETAFAADSREAIRHWTNAEGVYRFLGDAESELRCLGRAVGCSPNDYVLRRRRAARLIGANQFDDAIEELRWCQRRKPDDEHVKRLWKNAERMRFQQTMTSSLGRTAALAAEPGAGWQSDPVLAKETRDGLTIRPAEGSLAGRQTDDTGSYTATNGTPEVEKEAIATPQTALKESHNTADKRRDAAARRRDD